MKHLLLALVALSSLTQAHAAERALTVTAVGDLMLGSTWGGNYMPPEGANVLLAPAKATLRRGDVVFGNLEGVLLDQGGTAKTPLPGETYFVFRSPTRFAEAFRNAGFNLMSIANNHSSDLGALGRKSTMDALDRVGIPYSGLLDGPKPWAIMQANGRSVGLLAFATEKEAHDLRNIPRAVQLVKELDRLVDIVIVSFHGGAEGPRAQRVPKKIEMFEGLSRGDVHAFSRAVVDAGADLVLGHSPHVVRAMELYKGRLIAYSLGNFATYRRFNLTGPNGLAPLLETELAADGAFVRGKIHSFKQISPGGPKPDPTNAAAKKARELSALDFPGGKLRIAEDGTLTAK